MATTIDRTDSTFHVIDTTTLPATVVITAPRAPASPQRPAVASHSHRVGVLALLGLRLAVGFEFLWAFLDKTFGFGYSTSTAHAWINGGSPTRGFLSGVSAGPFQGIFNAIAGASAVDWLFMIGLLGVGLALILGVALRPAAIAGGAMLLMMYLASWPFATIAAGQPTGSPNPLVDDHIVSILALMGIAAFASWSLGPISRGWAALPVVGSHSWLR